MYEIRQIVSVGKNLEKLGVKIIWENIGDPVQKGEEIAPFIKEIVFNLVKKDASWAYTATQGYEKTRNFLAEKVNERGGTKITPDDILFFNGLGDAVAKIFGFMRREARILGPSPAYSTYSSAEAAHSGYEHLTYELNPYNGWMPDLDDIENKVRYNDSIAGILLINPDNPTGAVYTLEELKALGEVLKRHPHVLVATDDMYEHVNLTGDKFYNILNATPELKSRCIVLNGVSKAYSMTGWRIGYAAGPAHIIKAMEILQSQSTSNPTSISQVAAQAALDGPQECIEPMVKAFIERHAYVVDRFNQMRGLKCIKAGGAFYAFPDARPAIANLFNEGKIKEATELSRLHRFLNSSVGRAPDC
ncbi:MAG: aminotransferase class I/II-fold pyridoxal phosphate-dependent enzyme [Methylophilaceae bacterium]|nr:aminotransferase class I/II-fold pyridoxal phosphate-dependent enzyme [Methylophilaceae bacterium]